MFPKLDRFLAPYTEQIKHSIVKHNGDTNIFRLVGFQNSGFGIFQLVDLTCARFIQEAKPDQINDYLQILPKINVILICKTDLGWCAYPIDIDSSNSKFGINFEIIVNNVYDVERFDVITVRSDGRNFWYEEPYIEGDHIKSDFLRECFSLRLNASKMNKKFNQMKVSSEESKAFDLSLSSWRQFQRKNPNEIKDDYSIAGKPIKNTWLASVCHHDKDFDTISAGISIDALLE